MPGPEMTKTVNITERQHGLGKLHKKIVEMETGRHISMKESYEIAIRDSIKARTGYHIRR